MQWNQYLIGLKDNEPKGTFAVVENGRMMITMIRRPSNKGWLWVRYNGTNYTAGQMNAIPTSEQLQWNDLSWSQTVALINQYLEDGKEP